MEWTVVGVIVVLIGLVAAIVRPLLAWDKSLTENTEAIKTLTKAVSGNDSINKCEHKEFREQIGDHETRITVLEKGGKA